MGLFPMIAINSYMTYKLLRLNMHIQTFLSWLSSCIMSNSCSHIQCQPAATVIPIPKPNKDHTDPLSYRPIALTSCLCIVLERMINTRFIWYLEKYRILDKSQCGFRKHRSTADHLVSLERYLRDVFAQRQQAVGLFFTWRKLMRQPGNMASSETFTGSASEADCLFLCQNISGTGESESELGQHWRILPRGRCSNWRCPGCDMIWTED